VGACRRVVHGCEGQEKGGRIVGSGRRSFGGMEIQNKDEEARSVWRR
jgi:hypothetical protein